MKRKYIITLFYHDNVSEVFSVYDTFPEVLELVDKFKKLSVIKNINISVGGK